MLRVRLKTLTLKITWNHTYSTPLPPLQGVPPPPGLDDAQLAASQKDSGFLLQVVLRL